jgi:hypothetical protein
MTRGEMHFETSYRRTGENPYGTCPHCRDVIVLRERRPGGNDTCASGHVFPSRATVYPCEHCDGLGTPAGEAAGLICGACTGTGEVSVLSDSQIAAACAKSFNEMIGCPNATVARMYPRDHVRAIHKFGFHDGGAFASDHDAKCLHGLLTAALECLFHFDKIRPSDREPSAMVERLRKAIREVERA